MRRLIPAIFWLVVLLPVLRCHEARGQSSLEAGARFGGTVPATNFAALASSGIAVGGYLGVWSTDRAFVYFQASYDDFGGERLDLETISDGAFIPMELGVRYHPGTRDRSGAYISFAGGRMISKGDFDENKASLSLGAGFALLQSSYRIMLDATFRNEINDPFKSYLVFSVAVGSGGIRL